MCGTLCGVSGVRAQVRQGARCPDPAVQVTNTGTTRSAESKAPCILVRLAHYNLPRLYFFRLPDNHHARPFQASTLLTVPCYDVERREVLCR